MTYTLTPGKALREVFGRVVTELADSDPRIVVVDGDVGSSSKGDMFEKAHPERYLQMGIAEQNMLSAAAGLATTGLIPYISTFTAFAVVRPLDQIRVSIAQTGANVKITPAYAGLFTGSTGMSHIILDDLSLMRTLPGMVVIAPADDMEAEAALRWSRDYDGPVYIRLIRDATDRLFPAPSFALGPVIPIREGKDVTIFSTSTQTPRTYAATQLLAERGIDAKLVHVPTIKPVDPDGIANAAAATGRAITVEEGTIHAGLGGVVAEVLGELHPTKLSRIGFQDIYPESGTNAALLDKYGLDAEGVARQVERLL
ncbi:MAG: transketolase family protein [Propionibacteriaceae bacterium]|jgi:transketolase|nr:transketolase family protein [Propionibacteriaceae bacterium]